MSNARTPNSALHLQMGQEVIYLLLVTSLIANFVLAVIAMRSTKVAHEIGSPNPWATLVDANRRLVDENMRLNSEIEKLKRQIAGLESEVDAAKKAAEAQTKAAGQQLQSVAQATAWAKAAEDAQKRAEADAVAANDRAKKAEDRAKQYEDMFKTPDARNNIPRPVNDQPPIIPLRETDGFSFEPGKADISPEFIERLRRGIVPHLIELSLRYRAQVVEVIGHTDGTSLRDTTRRAANLDESLGLFLDPTNPVQFLPYDNVGLGMARAVSVARALRAAGLPAVLDIQPLSGASLISPKDKAEPAAAKTKDVSRRRIDIRIRRITSIDR